jgi:hypothetical protein
MFIARQRLGKHNSSATNSQTKIEWLPLLLLFGTRTTARPLLLVFFFVYGLFNDDHSRWDCWLAVSRRSVIFETSSIPVAPTWSIAHRWNTSFHFNFLTAYTAGRTPRTGNQAFSRPLPTHRTTQIQSRRTQTSMPWVEFEPMIPVFEREKTFHALDRAGNVIGYSWIINYKELGKEKACLSLRY